MYSVFPLYRDADDWLENPGRVWFSWSTFNPNGPTISCLGVRDTGSGCQIEVFYRWLHFLGGEDYCLGYVDTQSEDADMQMQEVLNNAIRLPVGEKFRKFPMVTSIPSMVVDSAPDGWDGLLKDLLGSAHEVRTADWGRERYLLQKYGVRLFDRAGEEIREGYEQIKNSEPAPDRDSQEILEYVRLRHQHIPSFAEWKPGQYNTRKIQDGDIDAWWTIVTGADFYPRAVAQFARAWVGAIGQASTECKTPFEEVRDFFLAYSHPWWPETITTERILERFGTAN